MATTSVQQPEKYLIFKVSNDLYGLEVSYLKEVFQTKDILKLPRTSEVLSGIVNLRGTIISIFDLSKLLWGIDFVPPEDTKVSVNEEQSRIVLLLTIKGHDVGILADQIHQLTDLSDFKSKDPTYYGNKILQTRSLIEKIAFLEDKQQVLIVNLEDLLGDYVVPTKKPIAEPEEEDIGFDFDQYTLPDEPTDEFSGAQFESDASFDLSLDQLASPQEETIDNFDLDFQEKIVEDDVKTSKKKKGKKADKADKAGKAGKAGKVDKAGKVGKTGKADKKDKVDKAGKVGKTGKADKKDKVDKAGKVGKTGKTDKKDKVDKAGKTGKTDKKDKVDKAGKVDKAEIKLIDPVEIDKTDTETPNKEKQKDKKDKNKKSKSKN